MFCKDRGVLLEVKKILIIAYHFPPQSGSSGGLRSLKFARYLPENGWLPVVLTAQPRAYERTDDSQLAEIPPQVEVIRAWGLDTRRHLSLRGRYIKWMALPDRWMTWALGAIPFGLLAIYRKRIDILFTTYPIASAVLIGLILHRLTGKPWVVDFRDSMTEDDYPRDPNLHRIYRYLERQAVRFGARLVFTARSTLQMYLDRYPWLSPSKCLVIPNGFDEEDISELRLDSPTALGQDRVVRLLHSGLIYPEERDPIPFFRSLARLKQDGSISEANLSVDLRACGFEDRYREVVQSLRLEEIVHFLPLLPYRESLRDAAEADALLLLQAANCDHQIPAKAYEYLRLSKPILALTTHSGDTAALLTEVGGATIADLVDQEDICRTLPSFLEAVRYHRHPLPDQNRVSRFRRSFQTQQLAQSLIEIAPTGAR